MPNPIKQPWATVAVILIPGCLGLMAAADLCGIGMCTFVPLVSRDVMAALGVAGATVFAALLCDISWRVPALVFTLPMALPAWIGLGQEWRRLAVAAASVAICWFGCFIMGERKGLRRGKP